MASPEQSLSKDIMRSPEIWRGPSSTVSQYLLASADASFLNLETKVTDENIRPLRKRLLHMQEVSLRPWARERATVERKLSTHRRGDLRFDWIRDANKWITACSGNRSEHLLENAALDDIFSGESGPRNAHNLYFSYLSANTRDVSDDQLVTNIENNRRKFITKMIKGSTQPNGQIDMTALRDKLFALGNVIHMDDLIYATMAEAVLSLPRKRLSKNGEKEKAIEQVLNSHREEFMGKPDIFTTVEEFVDNGEVDARRRKYKRRDFLLSGAAAATVLAGAIYTVETSPSHSQETERFFRPFAEPEANQVSEKLGINAGSFLFFKLDGKDPGNAPIFKKMSESSQVNGYLKTDTLLPIFPPAVAQYHEYLERSANEEGIPVNILGTIASIESAGDKTASSGVATGLMQIVPGLHMDVINAVITEVDYHEGVEAALEDPYLSSKISARILKQYYTDVLDKNPGIDPHNPVTWARALGVYNGGPAYDHVDYDNQPTQTQLYQVHAMRYFMTAEIAAQLRNRKIDDDDIARQLISKEIDARAYSYSENEANMNTIADYQNLWLPLSQLTIPRGRLYNSYNDYWTNPQDDYKFPISPGLRLWIVTGGFNLFEDSEPNKDESDYPANQK